MNEYLLMSADLSSSNSADLSPATLPLPQFSQINIQQLKQDIFDLIQRGLNLLAQVLNTARFLTQLGND